MLDLFAATPAAIGVSEVARQLGIPKSSAHGLLATLAARGYLAREATSFRLAAGLRSGNGLVEGPLARLIQIAQPVMRAIADASGESAFLSIMTRERQLKYVAKAVSTHEVRYDAPLIHPRPLYCSSSGLVILAHRPAEEVEEYLRRVPLKPITRRTIADKEEFRRVIAKAKRDGIAESSDANVPGAAGVSAPVLGADGYAIAAFALVAPTWRYTKSRLQMREQVRAGAADLMRSLAGYSSRFSDATRKG